MRQSHRMPPASIISTILVIAGGQSVGAGIARHSAGGGRPCVNHHRAYPHRGLPARGGQRGGARQPARHHRIHIGALLLQAMRIAIPAVIVAISVGTAGVHALLNSIPEVVTSGLNIAGGMIVVVGYAMVINMMRAGYLMPFFYLGFVTAAFTNFNPVALGVIGVVMAVLYIQLSPKYNKSQVVQPARLMRTISITNSTRNR